MKSLFSIVLGIVFCTALPCEAKSCSKHINQAQKTYVDPQAVKVTKEGVFLIEKESLIPLKGVFCDKDGIFVKKVARSIHTCQNINCKKRYDWNQWYYCPHCHRRH